MLVQNIRQFTEARLVELARTAKARRPDAGRDQYQADRRRPVHEGSRRYIALARARARAASSAAITSGPGVLGGQFVEPTIFTGVTSMRIAQGKGREVFGPRPVDHRLRGRGRGAEGRQRRRNGLASVWTRISAARCACRRAGRHRLLNTYRAVSYMMPFRRHEALGHRPRERHRVDPQYLETKSVGSRHSSCAER
ncbi:carnitine dehydratase, partial [Methylobacterium oryzae CBMB20]